MPAEARPSRPPKIDGERVFAALEHLASDALRGRYTLSPEDIGKAADFLQARYEQLGVRPVGDAYRSVFTVSAGTEPSDDQHVWIERPKDSRPLEDGDYVSLAIRDGRPVVGPLVAVAGDLPVSAYGKAVDRAVVLLVVSGPVQPAKARPAVEALSRAGARGVLVVSSSDDGVVSAKGGRVAMDGVGLPVAQIDRSAAQRLIVTEPVADTVKGRAPRRLRSVRISMTPKRREVKRPAPNVLAVLEGTQRAAEIVVLGAHYDHIGTVDHGLMCRARRLEDGTRDTVCNGADDNASGTAVVLEVATALAEAGYRPKRTLVFAHFAGEELGLWGSKALADEPPKAFPFDRGKVVAMVNLDMVGRVRDRGLAIGGVGSSSGWMPILDEAGKHGMNVIYERAVNSRSDHANFYRNGVPVLFFFSGLHADYHGPGDEAAAINREGLVSVSKLALDVVVALGDGGAIPFTPPRNPDEGEVSRLPGADPKSIEQR